MANTMRSASSSTSHARSNEERISAATRRRVLAAGLCLFAALAFAPAAVASTSPSLGIDQSAGRAAGATANLGLGLRFSNTGTDSPRVLTINLPPGLLANAAMNGGSCLKTRNVSGSACKVGSGTVTATPDLIGCSTSRSRCRSR